MSITQLPLADLVEDMDVYPRHAVDGSHVQSLVFALESGATLPPIVADKKSKRITDGWHRARAYKRLHGPTATVDVELVNYRNEAEMTFDAVERNSSHGRKLDAMDRTRCVLMLRSAGFKDSQISLVMHVPEQKVEKLSIKVANAPISASGNVPGTNKITLKRSVAHLAGTRLSKKQAEAHVTMPGTSFLLVTNQLIIGLREKMVNLDDDKLVAKLTELRDLLVDKLP